MIFTTDSSEAAEPVVHLKIEGPDEDGEVSLVGNGGRGEWLIASITKNGTVQPNKAGCAALGLEISNKYN